MRAISINTISIYKFIKGLGSSGCHLSARFKVRMGEWAGPLQKLPHVIPAAIPVATNAPVSAINSHSGRHNNKLNFAALHFSQTVSS